MKVNEIFNSYQGEGINIGVPTTFVRLSGCNFRCTFCDTLYALDEEGKEYTPSNLALEINKISSLGKTQNICITGGEPLIQKKSLEELVETLHNQNHFIEIETNGSIFPSDKLFDYVNQWNVSFKMENSGMKERYNPETIKKWSQKSKEQDNIYFKFVVEKGSDLIELESFVIKYALPRNQVILMPEGIDRETIIKRTKWLMGRPLGYRIIPRLHIIVYGNERKR